MPNETIVKYILAVETGKANKNLKSTSQASNQTEQAFDGVSRSTKTMNQKLRGTEKQSKKTSSGFRNMRKAGRDLDRPVVHDPIGWGEHRRRAGKIPTIVC